MTTGDRRLLLKLSGEGLAGGEGFGIHPGVIGGIADHNRENHDLGIQVSQAIAIANSIAKLIRGMTVINAMDSQDALEKPGVPTRVQTATCPRAKAVRKTDICGGSRARPTIHGRGDELPVSRKQSADRGLRHGRQGQYPVGRAGRRRGDTRARSARIMDLEIRNGE